MADGIEVDPATIRACAGTLTAIAQQVAARWQALADDSAGFGDIFGDDDVGGLIKASYQAALGVGADCMTSVAGGLADFGDGLDLMASEYEQVEQGNAELFATG